MSYNLFSKNLLNIGKLIFGVACFATAGSTFAGSGAPALASIDPWLSVNIGSTTGTDLLPAGGVNDGKNDFSFSGTNSQYAIQWDLTMNPDPFIDGSISITNLSSSTQNFTVTLALPVTPGFSPGVMSGSVDATVFDANNSGSASLSPQSGNIYFGRIDGGNVMSLLAQTLSCSGVGCNINSGDAASSIAVPSGVASSIGTRLVFSLSGNDKVTFSTHFEVLPVPVPAAAWLMSSALLGLVGIRRRK